MQQTVFLKQTENTNNFTSTDRFLLISILSFGVDNHNTHVCGFNLRKTKKIILLTTHLCFRPTFNSRLSALQTRETKEKKKSMNEGRPAILLCSSIRLSPENLPGEKNPVFVVRWTNVNERRDRRDIVFTEKRRWPSAWVLQLLLTAKDKFSIAS